MRVLELGMPNRQLPSPAITASINLLVYKPMTDGWAIVIRIALSTNARRRRSRKERNEQISRRLPPSEFPSGF